MTGRVFVAALIAAVVLFLWGGIAWMLLPKLHPINELTGGQPVVASIDSMQLEGGVYYWPDMADAAAAQSQPNIMFMVWNPEGSNPKAPAVFIGGFLLCFLQALLAAFLLNIAAPGIRKGYWGRVLFCLWLGLFAGLVTHMMYANWMLFPLGYTLGMMADTVIGWLLAGLVLAKLIRPATSAHPEAATAL